MVKVCTEINMSANLNDKRAQVVAVHDRFDTSESEEYDRAGNNLQDAKDTLHELVQPYRQVSSAAHSQRPCPAITSRESVESYRVMREEFRPRRRT